MNVQGWRSVGKICRDRDRGRDLEANGDFPATSRARWFSLNHLVLRLLTFDGGPSVPVGTRYRRVPGLYCIHLLHWVRDV
jgi:hypothetical protein